MGLVHEAKSPEPTATPTASGTGGSAPTTATPGGVKGMGYAAGKQALSPAARGGSAMVVGSCQTTEEANNNGLTARLLESMNRNPGAGVDAAIAEARVRVGRQYSEQHTTATTVGDHGARAKGGGRKHAVFTANAQYTDSAHLPALPSTISEANALQAAFSKEGYTSRGVHQNVTASQLKAAAATAVLGSQTAPGDHVVVHHGGHGLPSGLAGRDLDGSLRVRQDAITNSSLPGDTEGAIKPTAASLLGRPPTPGLDANDFLPYDAFEGIARAAVSKGIHVTMILDACHSGVAADLTRSRRDYKPGGAVKEGASADAASVAGSVAGGADVALGTKLALVGIVNAWEADRHAAHLEGKDGRAARLAEVDQRFLTALQSLWSEFIAARLTTLEGQLRAGARFSGPAPAAPTQMGSLAAHLTWLDSAYEALSAP